MPDLTYRALRLAALWGAGILPALAGSSVLADPTITTLNPPSRLFATGSQNGPITC